MTDLEGQREDIQNCPFFVGFFGTLASIFTFVQMRNIISNIKNSQEAITKTSSWGNVNPVILPPETNTELLVITGGLHIMGRGK